MTIHFNDNKYEPLAHPLIFLSGDRGWEPEKYTDDMSGRKVSLVDYLRYRYMVRSGKTNYLFNYGALTSQYMLDMWFRNESNLFCISRKEPIIVKPAKGYIYKCLRL